jgi:hypothetical protein
MASLLLKFSAVGLSALFLLNTQAIAAEDPIPYYLAIGQTETADTNIFRLPKTNGRPPRDLISTTALSVGMDQPLGRGRLVADLQLNINRYKNNRQLNYNGGQGSLRLDWESINRLSGDVSIYQKKTLYTPSLGGVALQKDVVSDFGLATNVRLGLVTLWSLEGGVAYNKSTHSSVAQSGQELNQTAFNFGVRLRPSDLWSAGVGYRQTNAKYPRAVLNTNGTYAADKVTRRDLDFSGDWAPTGISKFDARFSITKQKYSLQSDRTGSFLTGLIGYQWVPTGKTKLRVELARDTAVGVGDKKFPLVGQPESDSSVANSLRLTASWDATAKIATEAGYSYSQRKLEKTIIGLSSTGAVTRSDNSGHDHTQTLSVGANYRPTYNILLGCKLTYEKRSSNCLAVSSPYSANIGTCQVQIRI